MQERSPEEYQLMVAWTHILIDGFNSVLESLSGSAKEVVEKSGIKDAAKKAGINLPNMDAPKASPSLAGASIPNTVQSPPDAVKPVPEKITTLENINTGSEFPQREIPHDNYPKVVKDPRVLRATSSVECEYRMNQYMKQGWLDECFKQRAERLGETSKVYQPLK